MKEKKKRVKVFFTIEEDIYNKFEIIIKHNCIDKSLILEQLVKEWLGDDTKKPENDKT